jgi:hypothetical protein
MVNQLAGKVTYGSGLAAQAFMRVRQGDRFALPAGATLRIVYFRNGRQETWQGPATLRAGAEASDAQSGKPAAVAVLPMSAPQRIARLPDLVQGARLGGIVIRGGRGGRPTGPVPAEVEQARSLYKTWRGQASVDDVMPELYVLSVLQEHGYVDEMLPLAQEMLRRQPDTPEVRELAQWVQMRVNSPR